MATETRMQKAKQYLLNISKEEKFEVSLYDTPKIKFAKILVRGFLRRKYTRRPSIYNRSMVYKHDVQ